MFKDLLKSAAQFLIQMKRPKSKKRKGRIREVWDNKKAHTEISIRERAGSTDVEKEGQ